MRKKLVFIHNLLPTDGISGMVIFLRHFKRLEDWDIHILIPENSYVEAIVKNYPPNFFVHTFTLRKKYWLPFSAKLPFLLDIRLKQWADDITKKIKNITPDIVISVLAHFFCIPAALAAKKLHIPFYLFVHDNWAITNNTISVSKTKKYAQIALRNATKILPVSLSLVSFYGKSHLEKTQLLFPIPNGFNQNATWNDEMASKFILLHAGTINEYNVKIFEHILSLAMLSSNDSLKVIYGDYPALHKLQKYSNYDRIPFFDNSINALRFAITEASALLVFYGLEPKDNVFGMDSFPSRFVEFVHTGLPIICIAPEESEFYRFLAKENWPLLFTNRNIEALKPAIQSLKKKEVWEICAEASLMLKEKYFDPAKIHQQFLNIILNQKQND